MSLMPASSRLPVTRTEASTLSPIATTAVVKSVMPICSTAITSVRSACTVGRIDDHRLTSSAFLSTASTSCPIWSSVVATALPNRPNPTTSTLRLPFAISLFLSRTRPVLHPAQRGYPTMILSSGYRSASVACGRLIA